MCITHRLTYYDEYRSPHAPRPTDPDCSYDKSDDSSREQNSRRRYRVVSGDDIIVPLVTYHQTPYPYARGHSSESLREREIGGEERDRGEEGGWEEVLKNRGEKTEKGVSREEEKRRERGREKTRRKEKKLQAFFYKCQCSGNRGKLSLENRGLTLLCTSSSCK